MKHIIVNLQSFSDIITNSSSELFTINSNMDLDRVKELWEKLARKHESWAFKKDSHWNGDTVIPDSIEIEDGKIVANFFCMCNIGDEMREELEQIFGEENVKYSY